MNTTSDSRHAILARIRAALAGAVAAPDDGGATALRPADTTPPELVRQFVTGGEEAGATLFVVRDFESASMRLGRIVEDEGARSVVVSPDAAAPPWDCLVGRRLPGVGFTVRRTGADASRDQLFAADMGVTTADYGLADTGTLVVCSSSRQHRLDSLVPPVHVALVRSSDLLHGLDELFARLATEGRFGAHSAVTFIRGPSRTADVELTLSIGVHGPRKLYVVVVENTPARPAAGFGSSGPV